MSGPQPHLGDPPLKGKRRLRLWARLWRQWRERERWVLPALWLLSLLLGYVGFKRRLIGLGQPNPPGDCLYLALGLFTLKYGASAALGGWPLSIARFLAPAVAGYTALRALLLVFVEQWHVLRSWFARDHVVVCGLGAAGIHLTRGFLDQGRKVVVIDHDPQQTLGETCRDEGAIVLVGNATDPKVLLRAGVHRATDLIVVCNDDATNAEVAEQARELVARVGRRGGHPLRCAVQIEEARLYRHLRRNGDAWPHAPGFIVSFFNIYEIGAQLLLEQFLPWTAESAPDRSPHPLVIGVGRMGEQLILRAAELWIERWSGTSAVMGSVLKPKLRISILDRRADEKRETLYALYPYLADACDLEAVTIDLTTPAFRQGLFLFDGQGRPCISQVYICIDNDALCLSTGLALLDQMRARKACVPIIVRLQQESGLAMLLERQGALHDGNALQVFGLLNRVCTPDLLRRLENEVVSPKLV